MTREQIMFKYKCSNSDAIIIEKICTVQEWNKENPNDKINRKSGYVMPIYHGYDYKSKKDDLIRKYAYVGDKNWTKAQLGLK